MKCKNCGNENEDNAVYCSACGMILPKETVLDEDVFCSYCGSRNTSGQEYCRVCGTRLTSSSASTGTATERFQTMGQDDNTLSKTVSVQKKTKRTFVLTAIIIAISIISILLFMIYRWARKGKDVGGGQTAAIESGEVSVTAEPEDALKEQLVRALDGYTTVREWFDAKTVYMGEIDLTDAEETKLRDLDSKVGRLDVNNYQEQLDFIDTVNAFLADVYSAHYKDGTNSASETTTHSVATSSAVVDCSMSIDGWDFTSFPYVTTYVTVKDRATNQEVGTLTKQDFSYTWDTQTGNAWLLQDVVYDSGKGQYSLTFEANESETADDLIKERTVEIILGSDEAKGRCESFFVPANLMADDLLASYLAAYINDVNSHSFSNILEHIETNVDDTDHYTLFYQMRKELTGGFIRSLHQGLKEYTIRKVEAFDAQTLHLYSSETYEGQYEMLYSEWKNEGLNIADSIPIFTGSISGDPSVVVWAYVTQNPEYLLRKNSKGQWKFYSYTGDLSLNQNWSVYNASIS